MKKTSSKKSSLLIARGVFYFAFAAIFAFQPSAQAFTESQFAQPVLNSANSLQPASELATVSNKSLLRSALSSIEKEAPKVLSNDLIANPVASIYTYQNHYRQFARLVYAGGNSKGGYPYQAYEINPSGELGRLTETGKMVAGEFIRERIYDYKTRTVVLYNPKNVFEKRIFDLKENGEPGRPFQFRGRSASGDLINIRFFYGENSVTCVHMHGMNFATYELRKDGTLGDLLEMGTVSGISDANQPLVRSSIQMTTLERRGVQIPVYIFKGTNKEPVVVRERYIAAEGLGAMGRVLRFVSSEADLEYFYDDAVVNGMAKVKVLNHRAGESLTFEVAKKDLNETAGRFHSRKSVNTDQMAKAVSNLVPSILKMTDGFFVVPSVAKALPIYIRLNDEVLVWEKLLRGPPAFNLGQLDSVLTSVLSAFSSYFINPAVLSGVLA